MEPNYGTYGPLPTKKLSASSSDSRRSSHGTPIMSPSGSIKSRTPSGSRKSRTSAPKTPDGRNEDCRGQLEATADFIRKLQAPPRSDPPTLEQLMAMRSRHNDGIPTSRVHDPLDEKDIDDRNGTISYMLRSFMFEYQRQKILDSRMGNTRKLTNHFVTSMIDVLHEQTEEKNRPPLFRNLFHFVVDAERLQTFSKTLCSKSCSAFSASEVRQFHNLFTRQRMFDQFEVTTAVGERFPGYVCLEAFTVVDRLVFHKLQQASYLTPGLAKVYQAYDVSGCDRYGKQGRDSSCIIGLSEMPNPDNQRVCNLFNRNMTRLDVHRALPMLFYPLTALQRLGLSHNGISLGSYYAIPRRDSSDGEEQDDYHMQMDIKFKRKNEPTQNFRGGYNAREYGGGWRFVLGDYRRVTYDTRCRENLDVWDLFCALTEEMGSNLVHSWLFNAELAAQQVLKITKGTPAIGMALHEFRSKNGNLVDEIVAVLFKGQGDGGMFLSVKHQNAIENDYHLRKFFNATEALVRMTWPMMRHSEEPESSIWNFVLRSTLTPLNVTQNYIARDPNYNVRTDMHLVMILDIYNIIDEVRDHVIHDIEIIATLTDYEFLDFAELMMQVLHGGPISHLKYEIGRIIQGLSLDPRPSRVDMVKLLREAPIRRAMTTSSLPFVGESEARRKVTVARNTIQPVLPSVVYSMANKLGNCITRDPTKKTLCAAVNVEEFRTAVLAATITFYTMTLPYIDDPQQMVPVVNGDIRLQIHWSNHMFQIFTLAKKHAWLELNNWGNMGVPSPLTANSTKGLYKTTPGLGATPAFDGTLAEQRAMLEHEKSLFRDLFHRTENPGRATVRG